MQTDRFNNGKYVNWVKESLSLLYLKEGLVTFCDDKAGEFHQDLTELVRIKSPRASITKCAKCTPKSAVKTKTPDKKNPTWRMNCFGNVCSIWLEELLPYHQHLPLPNIAWENSDPQLWPSDAWEVAKLFQPYGCEKHKKAKDSDCTALLTMMLDCTFFHKHLSNTAILQEIKDYRNACMHSGDLEIEDPDMKAALDKMVALLEEPAIKNRSESIEAKEKIKQLRDNFLDMSLNKELELKALNHRVTEVRADVDRLTAEHRQLQTDLAGITIRQDSTVEEYNKLRERIVGVDDQITEMTKMIEALKHIQDDQSLNNKVEDLTSSLQELSNRSQQDVKDLSEKFQSTMAIFEARLQNLETRKEEEHEQSSKDVDANRIQTHLIEIYEKYCQRIPIYPLRPYWRKRLEDLYVKPLMTVEDPRGRDPQCSKRAAGQDAENRPKGYISDQAKVDSPDQSNVRMQNKEVKQITDIFYSDGKLCKNIIINGEMGTGKTSFCEHLVALWVRGKTSPRPLLEEESVLSNFTFLFYISLREANRKFKSCYRVESMISSQLQLTECEVTKLTSDYKCLVIMDGLDELSKRPDSEVSRFGSSYLPERPLRDKCVYITTTRPFKLELLSRVLEGQIDRQIAILGLDESSQESLAENVISLLNAETGKDKSVISFLWKMEEKGMTKQLKIPVLLTQLLGLWYDKVPVWDSQCSIYSSMIERQLMYAEKVQRLTERDNEQCTYHENTYPSCFTDQPFCKKYMSVLMKVAKLAYERLFDTSKENTLIFDHDQTDICGISDAEMKQLLHMGILTQQRMIGGVTEELKSISFLHKSHQEFFCAVYLSTNKDGLTLSRLFSEVVRDLETALELEQVFIFACGMNANLAAECTDRLMEKVSSSTRIKIHRQYPGNFFKWLIFQIQRLVLSLAIEARKDNKDPGLLRLDDIFLGTSTSADQLLSLDTSCAKSIYVSTIFELETWPGSIYFEKVTLSYTNLVECETFKDRFSAGQLVILHLLNVELSFCQLHCLFEKLSAATNLKEAFIDQLTCTILTRIEEGDTLCLDLSQNKRLEKFRMSNINYLPICYMFHVICNYISFSQDMKHLRSVDMFNINISAASLRMIANSLPLNGVSVCLGNPVNNCMCTYGLDINFFDRNVRVSVTGEKEAAETLEQMRNCSDFNIVRDDVEYLHPIDLCCLNWFSFRKGETD